ncbi:S-adenosyl-L-methionine-dependent methyltransferase [Aspergillus heteromorphus CBS 117.55]|uniref:S-adenosyl-L-methionine-dependent methyltransferase n=1 Tax=Aspergillus heteromorphus CBS 117.55 TaxID=1448321 RepID=A0A317VIX8_9EURO|nr:S-adenosyl-L-methionine-dependent methyltransferase [Aspergillus heteromorphus CBS 117.55]PWY72988.1 S-adenosyl-L-methionine-dependent methyltransferase [Aspergillus heteromorphus CBS 117.55]
MSNPSPLTDVSPETLALLSRLHAQSLTQEAKVTTSDYADDVVDSRMKDTFIALDEDKCHFMYQLCLATNAKTIVEAGTSYGVSTIYLALAVAANTAATGGAGRVIATEHEPEKARQARQHWAECGDGDSVSDVIDLREGDLRETLKRDLGTVDLLLLDIWAPLALPTLKLVQPSLRPGAVVLTDNTIGAEARYRDLFAYMRAPDSGFRNLTIPYTKGLEMSVYLPGASAK